MRWCDVAPSETKWRYFIEVVILSRKQIRFSDSLGFVNFLTGFSESKETVGIAADSGADSRADGVRRCDHHAWLEINFKPIRYDCEAKMSSEKIRESSSTSDDLERASRRLLEHAERWARNPEDSVFRCLGTGDSLNFNQSAHGDGDYAFFNVCNSRASIDLRSMRYKKRI